MAISFESALGIHEKALQVRTSRAQVLANNLANVDTPNFKAKDIDFRAVLQSQSYGQTQKLAMVTTDSAHQKASALAEDSELLYRVPLQPSIDSNTVDEQLEQAEFMKNALQHQASFTLLNKKFKGLSSAIKGN